MRRAFAQVKNGRSGPVMVEVPVDIVGLAEVEVVPERPPAGPCTTRSAGDAPDIDEAAKMLLDAACPLILAWGRASSMPRRPPSCAGLPNCCKRR